MKASTRYHMRVYTTMSITIIFILGLFLFMFVVAAETGNNRKQDKLECHARGSNYHYWQDRDVCVLYIK